METRFTCSCIVRNWCGGGAGLVTKSGLTLVTTWTVAHHAPLWDFLGKNTGVGCHFLLQGIFLTQGSNLGLLIAGGFFTAEPPGKPCEELRLNKLLVCEIR